MSKELDRIASRIPCLDTDNIVATLISSAGYHCHVWQSMGMLRRSHSSTGLNFVIKVYRGSCSWRETRIYQRQYEMLKTALDDIVPQALFVAAEVDGQVSVIVFAETVSPWFNLANPANEEEAVPLLRKLPKARTQLQRFVSAAQHWQQAADARVIDLYGYDNLVLDRNYNVRYIDSFEVFFNPDLLVILDQPDPVLAQRIEIALQRLDYLAHLLRQSG